jgi:heme/copper-type cytochrome/quinol oxidase subunit 1
MNIKKIKVHHIFWIVAVIMLIIGLSDPNSSVDINIHDTYFVIANYHLAIVLFLFYTLNGLGYWLVQYVFKKQLVKLLTIVHSVILLGSFLLYWIVFFYNPRTYTNTNFPLFDDHQSINVVLVSEILLILFIATPIYIINLLIGIFRKS